MRRSPSTPTTPAAACSISYRSAWLRRTPLLECLPGVGKVVAKQAMERFNIADSCRVSGLNDHQRAALVRRFGGGEL